MKAAYIEQTGEPEVIQFGELPDPKASATEVLIRVEAVSVNPIDTYVRSGTVVLPLEFPYVPGCDLAGQVIACGDQVSQFSVGDRVWGSNQSLFGRAGTFSELAAVDECWLYPLPEGCEPADAAAMALVGITAHLGLFLHAGLQSGETVFVNGGSGGVGSSVIQLAKAHDARVITTAGSDEKREYCRGLGADLVLDYNAADLDEEIQAFVEPDGVHVWYETTRNANPERVIPLLAKRGRFIVMAGRNAKPEFPVGPFYVKDLRMLGFAMFNATADEQRAAADELNTLLAAGSYRPNIGCRLPLSEAAQAHQLQEDNTLHGAGTLSGKIVLVPEQT